MITRYLLVGVLFFSVLPVAADEPAQTNNLLVEAARLMEEAATKSGMDQVAALQAVFEKLHSIVENHPSSNAAVRLVTGQEIGFLAIWKVEHNMVRALLAAGDIEAALGIAKGMSKLTQNAEGHLHRDMAFAYIAEAQSKLGDSQGARETANLIERDLYRNLIVMRLSLSQ